MSDNPTGAGQASAAIPPGFSFPDDEKPYQLRRRVWLLLFLAGLFLVSVALEIHNRALDAADLSANWTEASRAVVDPDAPPPTIDLLGNVLAVGAVVRNILPALLMSLLAVWFGARFTQAVHGISSLREARSFLWTSLIGTRMIGGPFIVVKEGDVQGGRQPPPVRIGGPGLLIVYNDSALLLEQASRLTRVVGPGFHPLRRFEKIREVVDLRPRQYSLEVSGMSREGIPVKCTVDIQYQINDQGEGPHAATPEKPHAYSEEAVFKAAVAQWLPEFDRADRVDWGGLVAGGAEGTLRGLLARHPLDRLIQPLEEMSGPEGEVVTPKPLPRHTIQQELEDQLRETAAEHGAKILEVALRNIELEDSVTQQWIETWGATWKKRRREELAAADAERERQMAQVEAEAEREMILAILDALQALAEDGKPVSPDLIVMRFLETLQRVAVDPRSIPFLPHTRQVLNTMNLLEGMVESGEED